MELSNKQIVRQDFVDNQIQQLLEALNPTDIIIDWDIENISQVREVIKEIIIEKLNICDKQTFYPYIED
jgi:hypothetical protein